MHPFVKNRKNKSISLVPMIDVLLCLLIFFMLTSQFINLQTIQLSYTKESGINKNRNIQRKDLFIRDMEHIELDGKTYSFMSLQKALVHLQNANKTIFTLQFSDTTSNQNMVNVIDGLRNIGISKYELRGDLSVPKR